LTAGVKERMSDISVFLEIIEHMQMSPKDLANATRKYHEIQPLVPSRIIAPFLEKCDKAPPEDAQLLSKEAVSLFKAFAGSNSRFQGDAKSFLSDTLRDKEQGLIEKSLRNNI
jgi:hypothetical protein